MAGELGPRPGSAGYAAVRRRWARRAWRPIHAKIEKGERAPPAHPARSLRPGRLALACLSLDGPGTRRRVLSLTKLETASVEPGRRSRWQSPRPVGFDRLARRGRRLQIFVQIVPYLRRRGVAIDDRVIECPGLVIYAPANPRDLQAIALGPRYTAGANKQAPPAARAPFSLLA